MTELTWTEKHLRYCIAQRLTPTAIKLYQWLVGDIGEGRQEIIDLHDFQKLVARERGKPHDFRVIQTAIARLADAGILRTVKKYSNFLWKWTIRPINRLIYPLIPKPKISELRSQIPNSPPSTDSNACNQVQAAAAVLRVLPEQLTSELEINLELLTSAGINFDSTDVPKILAWESPDDVKNAIALFQKRGGHAGISNAQGWIRKCLEHRWWEDKQPPTFTDALINLGRVLGVIGNG